MAPSKDSSTAAPDKESQRRRRDRLVDAGWLPASIVDRALSACPAGTDLLAFLVERSLLSRELADRVQVELERGDAPGPGEVQAVDSRAETTPDPATGEHFFAGRGAETDHDKSVLARFARARKAWREAAESHPFFSPHADTVLERVDKLGSGGMGIVYRVIDRRLGRQAALKILHENAGSLQVERFIREARITAGLDHPTIPPIYEAGITADGQHFLLMKLIAGRTLSDLIDEYHEAGRPKSKLREMLTALVKVCEGISSAHGHGVVHRDLKPDNLMIGDLGEVLVMDWGIARNLGAPGTEDGADEQDAALDPVSSRAEQMDSKQLTMAGSIVGTPGYMAPEQAAGRPVDTATDLFALGAVLMEILTNDRPIARDRIFIMVTATMEGNIRTPREVLPGVDRALDAICRRCLEYEPERRPASVREVRDELVRYLSDEPVFWYREPIVDRLQRFVRRHPALIVTCAATLFILMTVLLAAIVIRFEARERKIAKANATKVESTLQSFAEASSLARTGGDRNRIRSLLEEALSGGSKGLPTFLESARIYEDAGMFEDARRALRDASLVYPDAPEALFELHLLESRVDPSKIARMTAPLSRLAAKQGDEARHPLARFARAVEDRNSKRFDAALLMISELRKEIPNFAWLAMLEGLILKEQGHDRGARAAADRFRRLQPRHPAARIWLESLGGS